MSKTDKKNTDNGQGGNGILPEREITIVYKCDH